MTAHVISHVTWQSCITFHDNDNKKVHPNRLPSLVSFSPPDHTKSNKSPNRKCATCTKFAARAPQTITAKKRTRNLVRAVLLISRQGTYQKTIL